MTPRGSGSAHICLYSPLLLLTTSFPWQISSLYNPLPLSLRPAFPGAHASNKEGEGEIKKYIRLAQAKTLDTQVPRGMSLPGLALSLLCLRRVGVRVCAQHSSGALEAEGNLSAGIATRHYTNEI